MRTLFRKVFDWSQISYYISYYIYYFLFPSFRHDVEWLVFQATHSLEKASSPAVRWRAATKTEVGRYEGSQSGASATFGNSKSGGFLTWSFNVIYNIWDCFSDGRFWINSDILLWDTKIKVHWVSGHNRPFLHLGQACSSEGAWRCLCG